MRMPQISPTWEPTRLTLQKYAQALTAAPRSAADPEDRWDHVSMHPQSGSLATASIPLADGAELISTLDIANHQILIVAGSDVRLLPLSAGPSPRSVGETVAELALEHGTDVAADPARYEDSGMQIYDAGEATSWLENTRWVVDTFEAINLSVPGEKSGPHLWPHGFDIASEWFSPKTVVYNGADANAQIAIGFYPAGDAYFYVNPWPFEEAWSFTDLPGSATWHVDGWQGAMLMASALGDHSDREVVIELARAVRDLAMETLG